MTESVHLFCVVFVISFEIHLPIVRTMLVRIDISNGDVGDRGFVRPRRIHPAAL